MAAHERFVPFETKEIPERALLVGVERPGDRFSLSQTLDELERLAETAGAEVVGRVTQRMDTPNPRTFVGSGKAKEIHEACLAYAVDVVIFDDELTPSQQSNLESIVGKPVKVIDRTALILDIFALHATTKEGRLQVKLAQNQYLYPRLRGMWAHLASNRMGGGVGSRFGEGESQLEVDRRLIRNRITSIKRELRELEKTRATQRQERVKSSMLRIALAGYTNAGKSRLLNRLTSAEVLTYDKLFATLDATTRKYTLPEGRQIVLTDTVGFIQKLPTTLIESFKSTLDEISESDIVLHIMDASSLEREEQYQAVVEVLEQIHAADIHTILVLNKCDLLTTEEREALAFRYPQAVCISAASGEGIEKLIQRVSALASVYDVHMSVEIPYAAGKFTSMAHERCTILYEEHTTRGTRLDLRVPVSMAPLFEPYRITKD